VKRLKAEKPVLIPLSISTGFLRNLVDYLILLGQGIVGASNDGSPNTGLEST